MNLVDGNDGKNKVWRRRETAHNSKCNVQRQNDKKKGVVVFLLLDLILYISAHFFHVN